MNWHAGYAALRASGEWTAIAAQIPLRHPSQLYEATLEGLAIGVVLWWVYARRHATLRAGTLAALFLLLYAAARFLIEFTRQPDVQFITAAHPVGTVLGPLSMGQVLSVLVGIGGVVLLKWGGSSGEGSRAGDPPL